MFHGVVLQASLKDVDVVHGAGVIHQIKRHYDTSCDEQVQESTTEYNMEAIAHRLIVYLYDTEIFTNFVPFSETTGVSIWTSGDNAG